MDLSILIPARNEQFLARTVQDILEHIEAETEIIVVLDGALADPPIPQHPKVTVVYHPESIGQRAATNEAAKLARGKYVMKVDAHCSFDQGFDRKLLERFKHVGDNVTMVPVMKNLHAFDWVCEDGHRRYQGPSGPCKCGKPTKQEMVWLAKKSPNSVSYCFDAEPHFQYFGEFTKRAEFKEQLKTGVTETMSLQGSCFLLTKERYFALNICDESFGSWGSQGIEVACKTWLSGGRVLVNHHTWYAHLFRTKKDFGFPYPQSGKQVSHAKKHARDLFFRNKWPLQEKPLSWLVEKFWPVKGWTEEDLKAIKRKPRKGVVYYSHGVGDPTMLQAVRTQITKGIKEKHVISVTPEPLSFGNNIVKPRVDGWIDIFERILAGLEASTAEVIFLCEHDVLYHPSHFDFIPPEKDAFYYNVNVWKMRLEDGFCVKVDDCKQLSGLVAYRDVLIDHFRERVRRVNEEGFTRQNGFEPGTRKLRHGGYDDREAFAYSSKLPNIDIRHGENATQSRWKKEEFRNQKFTEGWTEAHVSEIDGWGDRSFTLDP